MVVIIKSSPKKRGYLKKSIQSFAHSQVVFSFSWKIVGNRLAGLVRDHDVAEEHAAGRAARPQTALQDGDKEALEAGHCDFEHLAVRCDVPDLFECQTAKSATPVQGDEDAAQQGGYLVGQCEAAGVAFVAVLPNAVHRVGAIRFGQDIFEFNLDPGVDTVGIAVD